MKSAAGNLFRLVCLAVALNTAMSSGAPAQDGKPPVDVFRSESGDIVVSQIMQMSVVITSPQGVIYTDPTRGKARYTGHPVPDIILVSHEHHEHFDPDALEEIAGPHTRIVVPPYVMERLPENLKDRAVSLANGKSADLGDISVEAIPAYGLEGEAASWHPKGRGNGYVVSIDGRRLYVAGSTEDTPEMRRLKNIDIAFLPLYPPYALGVDDAVDAVTMFKPRVTYIYQYNSIGTRESFVREMEKRSTGSSIIARDIAP